MDNYLVMLDILSSSRLLQIMMSIFMICGSEYFKIIIFLMHSLIIFDLDDTLAESKSQVQPDMAQTLIIIL